jgi:hypothetical protein
LRARDASAIRGRIALVVAGFGALAIASVVFAPLVGSTPTTSTRRCSSSRVCRA